MRFIEDHPVVAVVIFVVVVALAAWGVSSYLGPCHSQHRERYYRAPYTTTECSYEIDNTCYAYRTVHHPAACYWTTICDIRCKDWDRGQMEAHEKHESIITSPVIDKRCHGLP